MESKNNGKDNVNISLEKYNRLRDFNNHIRNNMFIHINGFSDRYLRYEQVYGEKDILKKIAEANASLSDELKRLKELKTVDIETFRSMDYWGFRNWKRNNL